MSYRNWSKKEIREYQKIKVQNKELGLLYILKDLQNNQPELRAKYLVEKLNLTAIDQEVLLRESSRAIALRNLEEIFIANFF